MNKITLGKLIKELRLKKGWCQAGLITTMKESDSEYFDGFNQCRLSYIENGLRNTDFETAIKILNVLGCDVKLEFNRIGNIIV